MLKPTRMYVGDMADIQEALAALERTHMRHASEDGKIFTCEACPLVCTEPCICLYQSAKVVRDAAAKAEAKRTHNQTRRDEMGKQAGNPGVWWIRLEMASGQKPDAAHTQALTVLHDAALAKGVAKAEMISDAELIKLAAQSVTDAIASLNEEE